MKWCLSYIYGAFFFFFFFFLVGVGGGGGGGIDFSYRHFTLKC